MKIPGRRRQGISGRAGEHGATDVPPGVYALLTGLVWVHALGRSVECEGCANDGEPGYCKGPSPSPMQPVDDEIVCNCGHAILLSLDECQCAGPAGWHCPGEDSQHWAKGEEPDSECGHCGETPEPLT